MSHLKKIRSYMLIIGTSINLNKIPFNLKRQNNIDISFNQLFK